MPNPLPHPTLRAVKSGARVHGGAGDRSGSLERHSHPPSERGLQVSQWLDRLGGLASVTCAAHCLVMAAAPALIPLLGLAFLADEAFEWTFFALAVGFALAAGYAGYRVHRTRWVLAGFGMGILVLLAGRLGEFLQVYEGGAVLAVVGGAILVASHGASTVQTRACGEACAS